jgi:flagellar L-ring protein FlgH
MNIKTVLLLSVVTFLTACGGIAQVGQKPVFSSITDTRGYAAMTSGRPASVVNTGQRQASLWASGPSSLLGDRRAGKLGDLMTVVIEINDRAEISNATKRRRSGSERLSVPSLLGLPQIIDENLPNGASSAEAIDLSSASVSDGEGSVRRKERLTLRIAATITEVLANGNLRIQGSQEVRVNYELRELLVTGFVRPEDISRKNEITYDKIASARISYGGRGLISSAQQPRRGQQVIDLLSPF